MQNRRVFLRHLVVATVCVSSLASPALGLKLHRKKKTAASLLSPLSEKERCPVCGMFVAPYPKWITQVQFKDGSHHSFDGMKCFSKFVFDPRQYDPTKHKDQFKILLVRDYYSLELIPHDQAYYVVGSDKLGPMGHELIPFGTQSAAKTFMADHHGLKILRFHEVSPKLLTVLDKARKSIQLSELP